MYIFIKITFSVYIKVINTHKIKNLFYALTFLSDGTKGDKHTEQFPATDDEGQSHSSHNHYAAEKLTPYIVFQL